MCNLIFGLVSCMILVMCVLVSTRSEVLEAAGRESDFPQQTPSSFSPGSQTQEHPIRRRWQMLQKSDAETRC